GLQPVHHMLNAFRRWCQQFDLRLTEVCLDIRVEHSGSELSRVRSHRKFSRRQYPQAFSLDSKTSLKKSLLQVLFFDLTFYLHLFPSISFEEDSAFCFV